MKFENNLDEKKPILEQLNSYEVTVSCCQNKKCAYKLEEAQDDFTRGAIWGMATLLTSIQAMDADHDFEYLGDNTTIGKIKYEIEENYLNEIFNDILNTMDMTLVSLIDEERSNKDAR